eukprot:scaffold65_cov353-Prasinococcus_capsulatus_cf.AAC.12
MQDSFGGYQARCFELASRPTWRRSGRRKAAGRVGAASARSTAPLRAAAAGRTPGTDPPPNAQARATGSARGAAVGRDAGVSAAQPPCGSSKAGAMGQWR